MTSATNNLGTWEANVAAQGLSYSNVLYDYGITSTTLANGLAVTTNITDPTAALVTYAGVGGLLTPGYNGYVVFAGLSTTSVTLNTSNLYDFGFYVEANLYGTESFTVTFTNGTSYTENITTPSGAEFFGFTGGGIASITINENVPNLGFVIGDFYSETSVVKAVPDETNVNALQKLVATAQYGVLANDTDALGHTLTVSAVGVYDGAAGTVGSALAGSYGTLTLQADGSYTYLAKASTALPSSGVAEDYFTYTAQDTTNTETSSAILTVVVHDPWLTYIGGAANTPITGTKGYEILDGTAGGEVVKAYNGVQVLIGGPGDTLDGGIGQDTFLFGLNYGANKVNGFSTVTSKIEFSHTEYSNFAAVQSHMSEVAGNTVITDGTNVITLVGVNDNNLHASNFIFA
jgi:VCBS repeat-containing protein